MAKLIDTASQIYLELETPDDLSLASITQFLRGNYSQLNNLLGKTYSLNSSLEIIDESGAEITDDEMAILKKIFEISYMSRKIRQNLGAAAVSSYLSVSSDGGSITKVNRTSVASTYITLRKELTAELKSMLNGYRFSKGGATPSQIVGDDIISCRLDYGFLNNYPYNGRF